MSVEIDPQELGFHRPFTVEVSEVLRIRNPNTYPVAFKTCVIRYCVRPNSGRVEPGKEVEVAVILQAMKQEPPMDTKCRDKFLVQSVAITGDKEFTNLASIWDAIDKSSVVERKIRVVFQPPKGSGAASNLETPDRRSTTNGADATPDVAPPAYSSPGDFAPSQTEPKSSMDDKEFQHASSPSGAGVAPLVAIPTSDPSRDDLKQQLAQAERMIAELKQDQGGLRQRKAGNTEEKPASKPAELAQAVRGTEGVPIQIAAVLCLLSFLLAYLFF
ncbi:Uu.00g102080.m01.CDS01 [Anthostomella pinea]|uniref:Uu.00g102080.m01.CDS01 n=1 Tax=Anthostomella pinea TaxID=933095 RepID=A0AAI8VDD7_9PEZI|nr:Uu.00g102080.m01.CDS01 [Anthostomella pinea]